MYKLRLFILSVVTLAMTNSFAEVPMVSVDELSSTKNHEKATQIITHIIDSYHYKKKELNDTLSAAILNKYLENLDQNRSFFIGTDIQNFLIYEKQIDDALEKPDLTIAFEIFKIYRQRVDERVSYTLDLLKQDFAFTVEEQYKFDRRELPWAADKKELNEIWRKRIKNDILNLHLADKEINEAKEILRKRYERTRVSTFQLDANDVYQIFINAYTTSIEPHTAYFSPRTSENFDISMRLSLEGIGAVLRNENEYTQVQRVIPGGPADLSNQIHADDKIIGVGQGMSNEIIDVVGWRLDDVVDLIRGPKDTVLRLELLPKDTGTEGPTKIISLIRNKIKLEEQAAKSSIIEIPDSPIHIGVIDLPTFYIDFAAQAKGDKDYKSTSRDVRKLIAKLQQESIDGLVIDLRGNGGGSLSEALELTGLFIKEGPIVQTKDSSGKVETSVDPDPEIIYGGPLAVLVDRNSASASEIFAGAIQDYRRGIIIGEPTFGKGTVQNVVDLNRFIRNSEVEHGRLKTTVAQFFRISGGSNQHKGVVPDIIFPTAEDGAEYGERALDNALPWDKVAPANYIQVSAPVDSFSVARNLHKDRIQSDKSFNLLLKELQLIRDANDKKEISLLESKRKKEREQLQTAKHQLKNELRIAQGLKPLQAEQDIDEPESESENEDKMDILLNETARILYDLIILTPAMPVDLQAKKFNDPSLINNNL